MRIFFFLLVTIFVGYQTVAQRACTSYEYAQQQLQNEPSLAVNMERVEQFIQRQLNNTGAQPVQRINGIPKIIIPVVVHIIYHQTAENISDEQVYKQLDILNNSFRRLNADTIKTPARFLGLAADCEIEFKLAVSDPRKRATNGIVRKYSPVPQWEANDNVKFSSQAGDDAWDTDSYLNIWVCNLRRSAGFASFPGGPAARDGIVVNYTCFGLGGSAGFDLGKTVVHEAGHWLGLKHIWGDSYCGDDSVNDTPKQGNFTSGCPSGIRLSCSNGPDGDMYMNYMDMSSDACTNLFTIGQKDRMQALFKPGGARYALNTSTGLQEATNHEIPLPEEQPKWQFPQLYPNPATTQIILDFAYDIRWVGKTLTISNVQGQVVIQETVSSKVHKVDISRLRPGLYFIKSKKEDGALLQTKFIKM